MISNFEKIGQILHANMESFCRDSHICIVFYMLTGYQCEQHNNPADFLLDVVIENEQTDDSQSTKIISYSN